MTTARNGIPPAPKRKPKVSWADFIKMHADVLAACDFFTAEVFMKAGLVTYYILFFIKVGSRDVHIAGITTNPHTEWTKQIARNITMDECGLLHGQRYLLHDGDGKFCETFRAIIRSADVEPKKLPPRSPNLNAFAERWVLSAKSECTSRLVCFGEDSLRKSLRAFEEHYREERNHQGKGNVLLFPGSAPANAANDEPAVSSSGPIECRERLGGLLKFYHRKAS